jgi:membrane protease YdiL (CAAX protease family)
MIDKGIETKRVWIFIVFAFGIAWTIDLAIYVTGGLSNLGIGSLAWILLVVSMASPSLAHILTRLLTSEGWRDLYLRPHFKRDWRFWATAWLGTPLLVLLGAGLFYALFPQYLDTTLATAQALLDQAAKSTGRPLPFGPMVFIVIQIVQTIVTAPLINGPAALGEEFGWRAYLLPKLMPLCGRKAVLLLGVIWGVWHWPIIAMGYNYGLDYSGAPWVGLLAMAWFTSVLGVFLAWLMLKAKSVWPAVIGHAAINSWAAIGTLLSQGQPNPLLGPTAAGLVGSLPFALVALWLLGRSSVFNEHQVRTQQPSSPAMPVHHAA